jgi:hypothetical protein
MNKAQEEAWIGLLLGVPILLIPGGVAVLIAYDKGMSFVPLFMFAGIAICGGLLWLFPFISGRSRKGKKKVSFDEREQLIHKKVVMAAYVVLWLYFVAACVITWLIVGPRGSVSVNVMPLTLLGGLAIFTFVQNLANLIHQYGWRDKGNE